MDVIFELKLNTKLNAKSPFELVFYITGYFKQFEKLRLEKLNKLKSPKVYDHNFNIIIEGVTQLYNQSIRGQLFNKNKDPIFEVSTLDNQINSILNHEINFFFLDDLEYLNVITKMATDNLVSVQNNLMKLVPNFSQLNPISKSKLIQTYLISNSKSIASYIKSFFNSNAIAASTLLLNSFAHFVRLFGCLKWRPRKLGPYSY